MQFLRKLRETAKRRNKNQPNKNKAVKNWIMTFQRYIGKKSPNLHQSPMLFHCFPLLSHLHNQPLQTTILLQLNDTRMLLFEHRILSYLVLFSFRHTWTSVETESRAKRWGTEVYPCPTNKSHTCSKQMSFYEHSDIFSHVEAELKKTNQPVTSVEYSSTGKSALFSVHSHSDFFTNSC